MRSPPLSMALPTSPLTALGTSPTCPGLVNPPRRHDEGGSPKRPRSLTPEHDDIPSILSSSPFTSTPSTPIADQSPKRRRRITDYDKLQIIIEELQGMRWSVGDFLSALCKNRGRHTMRRAQSQFFDFAYIDLPVREDFSELIGTDRRNTLFRQSGWGWAAEMLRQEIKSLAEDNAFGLFQPPNEEAELGSLEVIKQAVPAIQRLAPQWLKLIDTVCHEARPRTSSTAAVEYPFTRRVVTIFATLCHIMRPNRFTNFQTIMGLYLYQGGARRRVLDTLCQLGLITSYTTVQRRMKMLTAEAERRVQVVGQAFSGILTYDNLEFAEGKRGERAGDQRVFRSITTCLVIPGRKFNNGPMMQYMWHPSSSLLSPEGVVKRMLPGKIDREIHLHHIESAIRVLYTSYDLVNDGVEYPWTTSMPILQKLTSNKTKVVPLKPVMKDESTTSNNIKIIEDIYKRQFGLKEDDSSFHSGLRLIFGDLKTWSRICSVKKLRCDISEQSFDRFDWLLPGLGLWHLRLNMLQLIHKIHWGGAGPPDASTLQYAADRWHRARVVQPNDFQALEELIIHSYQARVVGIWIRHLRREKLDPRRIEETLAWLTMQAAPGSSWWTEVLNIIYDKIHRPSPTTNVAAKSPAVDEHFNNHQNYCVHVETYLTLRYAIKHADIGLLRHALRHSAVMFQAEAAGTPKYGQALLYTLHLIDSPAATMRLQDCVLANSLVNLRGAEDSNFELDRLLELLNNNLKTFQRERSNTTRNSDQLLENWALNGPYLLELKGVVEFCFGKPHSKKHKSKSAAEDVWSMALNLAGKSLCKKEQDRFSLHPTINLFIAGLDRLGENILKYNQQYDTGAAPFDTVDDDAEAVLDFIDPIDGAPDSPTIPTELLEASDNLFMD